jgi:hypothetical protein
MIDQCIYKVYQRDKKVFIPDLGAIIYSEYNDDVDFNEHLTFDDGKVVEEIQKQQFLSEEEARNALEEYVQDIKSSLGKGKLHFFGGIGYLSKDEKGSCFLQKSKPEKAKKTKSSPKKSEPSTAVENSPFDPIDERVPFDKGSPDDESSPPWSDAYSDESSSSETNFSDSADPYNYVESEEPERPGVIYREERSRNPLKTVFWIVVPILILAAGAYYYFNYYPSDEQAGKGDLPTTISEALNKEKTSTPEEDNSTENEINASESGDAQSGKLTTPSTSEVTPIIDTPADGGDVLNESKTYCLVLGSFKVERNADRYEQRLLSRGMDVKKFRGKDNFYFVGVDQIRGKTNAVKRLTETRQQYPNAWIINRDLLKI